MNAGMKGNSTASPQGHADKCGAPRQVSPWKQYVVLLAVFLLGVVIWWIPPPSGIHPLAWHLFAIFVATIVGIITKPLPMGAIAHPIPVYRCAKVG